MEMVAKAIRTPAGTFRVPFNPEWPKALKRCDAKEDLFELVVDGKYVNPDAIAEVNARGWYGEYIAWKASQQADQVANQALQEVIDSLARRIDALEAEVSNLRMELTDRALAPIEKRRW